MKAAREKKSLTYKGKQIRFAADLSTETWQTRNEWQDTFNVLNQKKYAAKNSLSSKAVIQNRKRDRKFPRQTKIKGVCDHYTSPARNFKGDSLRGEKMKKYI